MREYDEKTLQSAERVFEKGDKIIEQRQKRAAKIRHISYAVSGLCAAVIVCVGVWHFSASPKFPNDNSDGSGLVTATVTTAESTVTTTNAPAVTGTKNTSVTEKATVPSTARTTVTTANNTTANVTASSAPASSVRTTPVQTSASASTTVTSVFVTSVTDTTSTQGQQKPGILTSVYTTAEPVVTTTVSTVVPRTTAAFSTVSPTRTTTSAMSTADVTSVTTSLAGADTTGILQYFHDSSATVVIKKNYTYVTYEKENTLIPQERIGSFIDSLTVNFTVPGTGQEACMMRVYEIADISRDKAVAVQLPNTSEYYLFKDPAYREESFSAKRQSSA